MYNNVCSQFLEKERGTGNDYGRKNATKMLLCFVASILMNMRNLCNNADGETRINIAQLKRNAMYYKECVVGSQVNANHTKQSSHTKLNYQPERMINIILTSCWSKNHYAKRLDKVYEYNEWRTANYAFGWLVDLLWVLVVKGVWQLADVVLFKGLCASKIYPRNCNGDEYLIVWI